MESLVISAIEMGVAALPLPGQSCCGDLHVVKPFTDGILVVAMDGIGHGAEAASASKTARAVLEAHAEEPLLNAIRCCHEALRATRGVVLSAASFNLQHNLVTWIGIGNLPGFLLRSSSGPPLPEENLLLRAGVVGGHLPPLQAAVLPIGPGDTLLFATDGVAGGFPVDVARNHPPQKAADCILAQNFKGTDDALVLVVRYLGNRI